MHHLHAILLLIGIFAVKTISGKSKYAFSLLDSPNRVNYSSGTISSVTANELPILKRLSMRQVTITSSGIREPHWHPNAHELGYCLSGSALITIYGNNDEHDTFLITPGEMYFVPSGYLHHIENVDSSTGSSAAQFIVAFTHELPEDFSLSSTYSSMTNAVLGNTFGLVSSAFEGIEHQQAATVFGRKNTSETSDAHQQHRYPNKYRFDAESLSAKISKAEGSVKTVTNKYWPALKDISMYSLRLTNVGMREPHWHPETAEMGYVLQGHARMTVLSPDREQRSETYTLKPGDMYFIPRAYPHHIENTGETTMQFLIFFDQPAPGDVGFTGVFTAYSREVLAATLQTQPNQLPQFPFYPKNLLIVERVNPVDP